MDSGLILGILDLERIMVAFISNNISDFFAYGAVSKSTYTLIKQEDIYKHLLLIWEACKQNPEKHARYLQYYRNWWLVKDVRTIQNSKPQIVFNWASEYGYFNLVRAMVNNEKFGIRINDGFIEACRNGHLDMVQFLINNSNKKDAIQIYRGANQASYYGHLDVVQFLVKNGAKELEQLQAAIKFAIQGEHLNVVRFLVESDTNILYNIDSSIILACEIAILTCEKGNINIARYLVKKGADFRSR